MTDETQPIGKRRVASRFITAGLAVVVVLSIVAFSRLGDALASRTASPASSPTTLQGTDLGKVAAPDIRLQDQTGATVALSGLRGRPIVLTFLDSHCPHAECPLMIQYLNWTTQFLTPSEVSRVAWVALSVNPADTPASAAQFLQNDRAAIPLHFLLGSRDQLAPLWKAYHMSSTTQPDGIVIHMTGVYVIDGQGRERVWLDQGFDPKGLAADLRILLGS